MQLSQDTAKGKNPCPQLHVPRVHGAQAVEAHPHRRSGILQQESSPNLCPGSCCGLSRPTPGRLSPLTAAIVPAADSAIRQTLHCGSGKSNRFRTSSEQVTPAVIAHISTLGTG